MKKIIKGLLSLSMVLAISGCQKEEAAETAVVSEGFPVLKDTINIFMIQA